MQVREYSTGAVGDASQRIFTRAVGDASQRIFH